MQNGTHYPYPTCYLRSRVAFWKTELMLKVVGGLVNKHKTASKHGKEDGVRPYRNILEAVKMRSNNSEGSDH